MVVGAISSRTELAIIGAGPGGYVAALRAADAGLDVTLIDRSELGGTCLNVGCIPSKTLIEIADLRHRALASAEYGLDMTVDVRVEQVMRRLATVSGSLRAGVASLLQSAGVEVVPGTANFARYDRLSIAHDGQVSHLEFDNAIVATGSRPIQLADFPIRDRVVDSSGALSLTSLPASMAIIGGGYIGIELGTAWAKLGVAVTVIEATDTILPSVPTALRAPVVRRLGDLGVQLLTNETAAHPTADGLVLHSGAAVPADVIVVAAGRVPNSDVCSLDTVGVSFGPRGHVVVDDKMQAASNLYAIGDLVEGPALAHRASAQAETAVDAILGRPAAFAPAAIPAVVFSDPEIMSVGVTPEQAATLGMSVHRFPHLASARAHTMGATDGFTMVVADADGTITGVHAVGPHVSELAGEATLAIEMAATLEDLSLTIHPHPTLSETLVEAALLARGLPLHIRP